MINVVQCYDCIVPRAPSHDDAATFQLSEYFRQDLLHDLLNLSVRVLLLLMLLTSILLLAWVLLLAAVLLATSILLLSSVLLL